MASPMTALPEGFVLDEPQQLGAQLPEGFVLDEPQAEQEPSMWEKAVDLFTGESRTTPQVEGLQEIGSAPELNEMSMSAFKTSLGLLTTGDDEKAANVIKQQIPDSQFSKDEKGNTIVTLPSGDYVLNKPGFSPQDLARTMFGFAAFTPAGRAATIPGAVGGAAATETAIQATGEQVGAGPIEAEDVIMSGALGGAGKALEDVVTSGIRAARGKIAAEQKAIIEAGEEAGVPVMTTDVIEPKTLTGKLARSTGELVPIAGTGKQREAQQAAREQVTERFASQYTPQFGEIVEGLKRQTNKVKRAAGQRLQDVKTQMDEVGQIPTDSAVKAIDDEIAKLTAKGRVADDATVSQLQRYKDALEEGQTFESLDTLRSDFREAVKGERTALPTRSDAAINRIYNSMTQDLEKSITENLGKAQTGKWRSAKAAYAEEFSKIQNTKIKSLLQKGDFTPEQASQMLFSKKPSEIKTLYQSLDSNGKEAARATVIAEAVKRASGRVNGMTPNGLASELNKMKDQLDVVFKGQDRKQLDGLIKLLNATKRAQDAAVATPTGQSLAGIAGGYAAFTDLAATLGSGVSVGGLARAYESAPVRDALLRLSNSPKGSARYDTALQAASEAIRTLVLSQPGEE